RTIVITGRPELGAPDWRGKMPGRPMSDQEVTDVVAWLASHRVPNPGQPYSASNYTQNQESQNVRRKKKIPARPIHEVWDCLQWTGRNRSCRTVRTISLFFGHARTLGILPVLGASRSRKRIPRG